MAEGHEFNNYLEQEFQNLGRALEYHSNDPDCSEDKSNAAKSCLLQMNENRLYHQGLLKSLGKNHSVNTKNQRQLLKFLYESKFEHFPFIEFANLIDDYNKELDIKRFIKILVKLILSPQAPLDSIARFLDHQISYYPINHVLKGYSHPERELQKFYSEEKNNLRELEISLDGKKIDIRSTEAISMIIRSITSFRKELESLMDARELSPSKGHLLFSKYKQYIAQEQTGHEYHYQADNGLILSSFLDYAWFDFLRFISIFDDKFAISRLGKCEWCSAFFIKTTTLKKFCTTKHQEAMKNQ
jgi:hypothetical protein